MRAPFTLHMWFHGGATETITYQTEEELRGALVALDDLPEELHYPLNLETWTGSDADGTTVEL